MTEMILHKSGKAAAKGRLFFVGFLFFAFLFTYEFAFFGEFSSFVAMNGYFSFFCGRALPLGFLIFAVWPQAVAEMEIRFNRDVRPILSDNHFIVVMAPIRMPAKRIFDWTWSWRRKADRCGYFEVESPVGAAKGLAARMEP